MIKSNTDKARIRRQKLRSAKRAAALHVKKHKTAVGSNAYKATLEGFKAKGGRLPRYFNQVINNARQLIFRRKLEVDEGGISRHMSERTKRKLFEVVVTLITTCDLMSGQIGKAKNIGMDTTSHDALMLEHAKRWGEPIPSSTWYRYIDMLKQAGVFAVQEVKVAIDKDDTAAEQKTIRSVAAYKWLTAQFLQAIGVYSDEIRAQIKLAYQKALDKGLSFTWRVFKRQLPVKLRFTADMFFSQSTNPPQTH